MPGRNLCYAAVTSDAWSLAGSNLSLYNSKFLSVKAISSKRYGSWTGSADARANSVKHPPLDQHPLNVGLRLLPLTRIIDIRKRTIDSTVQQTSARRLMHHVCITHSDDEPRIVANECMRQASLPIKNILRGLVISVLTGNKSFSTSPGVEIHPLFIRCGPKKNLTFLKEASTLIEVLQYSFSRFNSSQESSGQSNPS